MLYTVKEDLDICIEFKITPAQLLFIKMLVPDLSVKEHERRKHSYALSMRYQGELGGLTAKELSDLLSREIIIDHNDYGKTLYEYYEINPKFYPRFSLKIYPMSSELCDAYPSLFTNAAGKEFIARNCSAQEIAPEYMKAICKDLEEHKKVMDDLEWAKKNKAIVMGLRKFVDTKYWLAIRELRAKQNVNKNSTDVTIL